MKKKIQIVVLISILALVLGACAAEPAAETPAQPTAEVEDPAQTPEDELPEPQPSVEPEFDEAPLSVTDDLGTDLTLEGPAQKIVAISPSMTEIVFAIGAGDRLIARESNSLYPEEALEVQDLGALWDGLPVEDIVALEPDLILAAEIITADQVGQLQELGLNVFWQKNPDDFDGLYENIREISVLTGNEDQAEEVISSLQERVAAVDASLADVEQTPLVFYELDATDPINPWTTGSGTFISYIINKSQGENLGDVLEGEWAQISSEELVAQNPDVILLADAMYGVTAERVAERAGWTDIQAVQDGEIYPVDPSILSVPGPRLVDGYELVAGLLHPESMEN
jgi:iron complex transport system substrate-binding protein